MAETAVNQGEQSAKWYKKLLGKKQVSACSDTSSTDSGPVSSSSKKAASEKQKQKPKANAPPLVVNYFSAGPGFTRL